jgi:hypothetical protein
MQLRKAVDELVARRPPPARELSRLDPELRPVLAWGALSHPDPAARRLCLDYLDHLAGPEAAETFAAALDDPVPRVRRHAIHALTCDACKPEGWCVDAVTPFGGSSLTIRVLRSGSSPCGPCSASLTRPFAPMRSRP